MPARGQQNTDRGEHRGPDQSQIGAGARDGVRHGCAIIPPALPIPYGRGGKEGPTGSTASGRTPYTPSPTWRVGRMSGLTRPAGLHPALRGYTYRYVEPQPGG
ncbi:hypothetical protein GCM10010507_06560 [Streptomyces cinnamoneus]|uniref:Uncharacterized protein n=1 Tax=Streptomyces cinnamoneus TaxID=53446 RepID=A0A918WE39_STRCJ|nr:hypothetical protein GCM10010507_06560 [Streptomyces cinnamoneus]